MRERSTSGQLGGFVASSCSAIPFPKKTSLVEVGRMRCNTDQGKSDARCVRGPGEA